MEGYTLKGENVDKIKELERILRTLPIEIKPNQSVVASFLPNIPSQLKVIEIYPHEVVGYIDTVTNIGGEPFPSPGKPAPITFTSLDPESLQFRYEDVIFNVYLKTEAYKLKGKGR